MDQRLDGRGGGWVGGGPESGPSQVSQTRRKPTKPITGILVRIRSASLRSGLGCRRYGGLRSSDAVPPGEVRLCARLGQPAVWRRGVPAGRSRCRYALGAAWLVGRRGGGRVFGS